MDSCCIFNDFIVCTNREIQSGKCQNCGWNPDVAKARRAQSKSGSVPMASEKVQERKNEEKMTD